MDTGRALSLLAAASVALSGCKCSKRPDEEQLRKRIDSTKVHLYLSAKIALSHADSSPEVTRAREQIVTLLHLGKNVLSGGELREAAVAPTGDQLTAKDAAKLAVALWALRRMGKEAFAADRADYPAPVLPSLLRALQASEELVGLIDADTEHGILLVALTLLKAHPKTPVPIPSEIILYEAWKTRPEKVRFAGLAPSLQAVKAYAYATHELCDLAAKETTAMKAPQGAALLADLGTLTGVALAQDPTTASRVGAALEALAHGSTALCYFQRDEAEKAHEPLGRFLDGAEALGLKLPELTLLRAYLDCAEGEPAEGKRRLKALRADPSFSPELGDHLAVLDEHCGSARGKKLLKKLDRALFATVVARVALEHLERSGLHEKLGDTQLYQAVRRFAAGVAGALGAARDALPSRRELER